MVRGMMSVMRGKFDLEFRGGAVRIVAEICEPSARVARDLGISDGALVGWAKEGTR